MATTTTNLGLTKPSYSDTADIAVINGNMDKIDTAANALEAGFAIISNNNTHDAISSGQYVYVRGHGTLAEGLYKATTNIAANGTLSGSNLTSAKMGNDLVALSDQIVTINNKINTDKYRSISSLSDFETYRNDRWNGIIGGTAVLNLGFTANICFITISFNTSFIHVYAIRANGEVWNLNKNNGTWDNAWVKMFG